LAYGASLAANNPNEDRTFINCDKGLFGIFDGHGGSMCSSVAAKKIGGVFTELMDSTKNEEVGDWEGSEGDTRQLERPRVALKKAFEAVDKQFLIEKGKAHPKSGSCAVLCYIGGGNVWTSNLGDSRAIRVVKNNGVVSSVNLSKDH
jgi:serine/threonine protein phosphatase PrpC